MLASRVMRSSSVGAFVVLASVIGLAQQAAAAVFQAQVKNTTGVAVDDVHLVFSGTAGFVDNVVALAPAGAAATRNGPAGSANGVEGTFTPALPNNGTFTVQFTAPGANAAGGEWTRNSQPDIPIAAEDVTLTEMPDTPVVSGVGMIVLTLLLPAAGALAVRRSGVHRG